LISLGFQGCVSIPG